ncbi:HTTM domain-containing protein [soil metagenome]
MATEPHRSNFVRSEATCEITLRRRNPRGGIDRAHTWLAEPIEGASVAAFRRIFGLVMLVACARFVVTGCVGEYFATPTHFFHYRFFGWVEPLPVIGMYVLYGGLIALAAMIALGKQTRVAVAMFGVGFAYAHLVDKTNYLNHYYLVICTSFLLAALPTGNRIPRWVLVALRAQIALVYIFGGVAKLKAGWLFDAQPLSIWLRANGDFPLIGWLFEQKWVAFVFAWTGAAFDLCIVPLLVWRRSRPFAYVLVVVFHVVTARLFHLGMFPWIMMASSLIFLAPEWPRHLGSRVLHRDLPAPTGGSPRRVPALLVAYFAFALLFPLRHLVIPGDVLWTEEGFRFSWHVMVMQKDGSTEFHVREPGTNRRWDVNPSEYLTRFQTTMMSSQPDEILELAHIIADDFRARGVRDPEVTVDAFVSLNGAPRERLIDPTVDLGRATDGWGHAAWILPRGTTK